MRRSYTAVVERGEPLQGRFATEPYEAGWATEALVFVRVLEAPAGARVRARVQISPDGMHWADEGTTLPEVTGPGTSGGSTDGAAGPDAGPDGSADGMSVPVFARVREFGNWLRVAGSVTPGDASVRALVYFVLKE
jgi:hypothetical protein